MKLITLLLACGLACSTAASAAPADPCAMHVSSSNSDAARKVLDAMYQPVDEAIAVIDNAEVRLSSPTLASGTLAYLSVTPNFADRIAEVCVLGYFELERNGRAERLPLLVEHIETVKPAPGDNTAPESTRIYFRTPHLGEFNNAQDLRGYWRFWEADQRVQLRIAGFQYRDGVRGAVYFGREQSVPVSGKTPSIIAALLFAGGFYVAAAAAISLAARRAVPERLGWRATLSSAMPWSITSATDQSSLSQLQMLLFTLIVATLLFYQWLRTGVLQELSTDLLYLIGISTAGAAGIQVTASVKKDLQPDIYQYLQRLGWFTAPLAGAKPGARASGLLLSNERFDVYKFQMLVFTVVIAAYVIATGANELANIQISATLLTLMGMSQGAYIGGRAASDNLTPLQDQLRGMQALQKRYSASSDAQFREELRRRFALAAAQAGDMFSQLFQRELPPYLLDMPLDPQPDDAAPSASEAAQAAPVSEQ